MAASEEISDQLKKIQQGRPRNVIAALITQERSQKLDLLIHLIRNLKQSLVICGPKGIGKTTLLSVFQKRTASSWPIVLIAAAAELRVDHIRAQIEQVLAAGDAQVEAQGLDTYLRSLEPSGRRVVLLIDDAGSLAAGVTSQLLQYADAFPAFRLVLSLTDEDLVLKHASDPLIDACQFIEIPPLSETQCGEYLRHLTTKIDASGAVVDIDTEITSRHDPRREYEINDAMREQMYKQTQGIPGKVRDALPGLRKVAGTRHRYWLFAAVLVVTLAGIVGISNLPSTPETETTAEVAKPVVLAIPGQTAPPVETTMEAINATGQVSKLSSPEAMGKPDLYNGYGRTHEADSLETVEVNSPAAIAEQLKVEIIPSEDPPPSTPLDAPKPVPATPVVQASGTETVAAVSADVQHAAETLAAPVQESVTVEATKAEKAVVKKVITAEQELAKAQKVLKEKALVPTAKPKKLIEPVVKEPKSKQATVAATDEDEWSLDNFNPANLTPDDLAAAESEAAEPVAATKSPTIKAQTDKTVAVKSTEVNTAEVADDGAEPAADSGAGRYTLQVIAFSRPELLDSFMQKHRGMGGNLRYITVKKEGGDHYLVFYGAYASTAEANAAKRKLPAEFSQAWARKM